MGFQKRPYPDSLSCRLMIRILIWHSILKDNAEVELWTVHNRSAQFEIQISLDCDRFKVESLLDDLDCRFLIALIKGSNCETISLFKTVLVTIWSLTSYKLLPVRDGQCLSYSLQPIRYSVSLTRCEIFSIFRLRKLHFHQLNVKSTSVVKIPHIVQQQSIHKPFSNAFVCIQTFSLKQPHNDFNTKLVICFRINSNEPSKFRNRTIRNRNTVGPTRIIVRVCTLCDIVSYVVIGLATWTVEQISGQIIRMNLFFKKESFLKDLPYSIRWQAEDKLHLTSKAVRMATSFYLLILT